MRITSATLIGLLCFQVETAHAQKSQYPTLEDFNNILNACAAGASISLTGEMKGNFESVYKDKVVDAPKGVVVITSADFLKLLPEKDRLEGFKLYQACVVGIINGTITKPPEPPEPPRVPGWVVTLTASGAGGGNFDRFPSRTAVVSTPAAIDIRSLLPASLSNRNVFITLAATTDHNVTRAGLWMYNLKLTTYGAYTQCTKFDVATDGVPIGGGSLPIMQGPSSTEKPMSAEQKEGRRQLSINLACYVLAHEFPVLSLMLKLPSGESRRPTASDFTVAKPD